MRPTIIARGMIKDHATIGERFLMRALTERKAGSKRKAAKLLRKAELHVDIAWRHKRRQEMA